MVTRRKWAVVIIFLTTVLLATLVSLRMPKIYQTNVTIKINQRIPSQSLLTTFYYDPNFLQTEIEMVKSRATLIRVANRLGVTYKVTEAPPRLRAALNDVEVLENAQPGELELVFASSGAYAANFDGRAMGTGRVGDVFEAAFGTFVVRTDKAHAGDVIKAQIKEPDAVAASLGGSVQVKPIEGVNIVRLVVKGRDPTRVAELANALADVYVEASLTEKRLQATTTRVFIEDQIERTADNLRAAEGALEAFKRENGIVDMPSETRHYVTLLGDLESELLTASLERQINAAELDLLRRRRERAGESGGGTPSDEILISRFAAGSALADIENNLLLLQRKRSELLLTRTPDHPDVRAVDAEISAANQDLAKAVDAALERGELATDLAMAAEKVDAINSNIEQYREIAAGLPEKEMELNRLVRNYQVNEQVYTMLLEKLQEAKINEAMETADIRVVDYALVPKAPVSPNYFKNILVGILLGVFLGLGAAYALEFSDTSLNTVEEVERHLKRAVIGIIPRVGAGVTDRGGGAKANNYFVTHQYPKSPVSEAYRTLRTAVLASSVDEKIQRLLVTSTGLSEGKTTTSINLSIIFAQTANRALLMDCDLRRAAVHKAFGFHRVPGLADVLMGTAELNDALRETDVPNLTVLPSGIVPPNPSELLGSKKFEKILDQLAASFDIIVMDAPPVLAVTDPLVLSRLVDGTCYVVCAGRTDRNAARRGLRLLERTGSRLLGVVLNQVDVTRVYGTYGYKYYSQYYRAYAEGQGEQ